MNRLLTPAEAARTVLQEIETEARKLNKRDRRKFYNGLARWFMGQRSPPRTELGSTLAHRRPPSGE